MHRIAIINQKGGVGKTTTAANLSSALAGSGLNVMAIDMDPQAHLTMHFGIEPDPATPSIYQLLTQETRLSDVLQPISDRLSVAPANIDLAAAEVELASVVGREVILRDALAEYNDHFRFALIDCPPSLGILTLNALCAADDVFITLQPHFLALQGLGKLLETISLVARRINPHLKVRGVVVCMYESGTKLAAEVTADLEGYLKSTRDQDVPWSDAVIFETVIRRNIKLAEAPSFGQDIFRYAPQSHGAQDYAALGNEVLAMYDGQTTAPKIDDHQERPEGAPAPIEPSSNELTTHEEPQTSQPAGPDRPSDLPGDPTDGYTYSEAERPA